MTRTVPDGTGRELFRPVRNGPRLCRMASVNVERTDDGFVARNARGAAVQIGSSDTEGV